MRKQLFCAIRGTHREHAPFVTAFAGAYHMQQRAKPGLQLRLKGKAQGSNPSVIDISGSYDLLRAATQELVEGYTWCSMSTGHRRTFPDRMIVDYVAYVSHGGT